MIFIILGSQKFQFNRLLKKIDDLIQNECIYGEVFAQIGYSTYKPRFYKYKNFLNRDDFLDKIESADLIITHGGTGAIINAIKRNKKVIAIPRSSKFCEHVDDHQKEIINVFKQAEYIESVENMEDLGKK